MTYTEEQVKELIETNLKLMEEKKEFDSSIRNLEEALSKEKLLRESAEKKYSSLCERCINFYVTNKEIDVDSLFIQVNAPRFMNRDDFSKGLIQHIISSCVAERDRTIYSDLNTSRYKPKT